MTDLKISPSQLQQLIEAAPLDNRDIDTLAWIIMSFDYLPALGIKQQSTKAVDNSYLLDVNSELKGKSYLYELIAKKPFTEEELNEIFVLIKYFYLLSPIALFERPHLLTALQDFSNSLYSSKEPKGYQP